MNKKVKKREIRKVVLYLRFSCSKQNETSIEGQERVCREFAKAKGYEVVGTYIDRATSASKDIEKRTNFLEMIKDAKKGNFDAVLVYKIDRFSRNAYDTVYYLHSLENCGVSLLTAVEGGNDNTPEDKLIRQVMIGFSEYYSLELSQKTIRGMRTCALKGQVVGGNRLYGYNIVNKKYVVNEEEGPVVKEIFARVLKGEGIKNIVDSLNARGLKYKKNKFTVQNITQLLTFRGYLGEINFQDIRYKNAHEALVSYEDFEKVQNRPKRIRSSHRTDFNEVLFSGKIFCGECGSKVIGTSAFSHTGKSFYYYSCAKRSTCSLPYFNREVLNNEISSLLFDLFSTEKFYDEVLKETLLIVKNSNKDVNKEIKSLDRQIGKTEEEITNLIMYCKDDSTLKFIKSKIEEKKLKINYLSEEKAKLVAQNKLSKDKIDMIKGLINELKTRFAYKSGVALFEKSENSHFSEKEINKDFFVNYFKEIFDEIVEKIILYKDKSVEIVLKANADFLALTGEKNLNFEGFTVVLPKKLVEINENKGKIKDSLSEENNSKSPTDLQNNEVRLSKKWPPRQNSNPQPFGS